MAKVEQSFEAHTKSVDGNGRLLSAEIPYIVFDAIDESDALQAVLDAAPQKLDFNGSLIRLSSVEIDERCNAEVYKVNASYEKSSEPSSDSDSGDNAVEISFSTGGGSKHVVDALAVKSIGDNSYCGNRIGWNGKKGADEEFAGVDIPDSNLQLTLTVTKNMSALNTRWQRNIAELTGKVNDKKFRGYERGEVLFDGCSFSGVEGSEDVKVSYNFSIRLNEKGVKLGKGEDGQWITADKLGFQYIWTVPDFRDDGKNKVNFLKLVRLDTVIPFADFSKLGV